MSLVSQSIQSLYGGVSQQAASVRSPNQVEAADNCYFTIAEGASKRPPLETVASLGTVNWGDAFVHYASLGNGETYIIIISGGGTLRVYRKSDGVLLSGLTVTSPYLIAPNARKAFRAFTVGEKTYVVNTGVKVVATNNVSDGMINGTAQTLQDTSLDTAPEGSTWQINGDPTVNFDIYYARKISGSFVEWVKPGIQDTIDASTMPHVARLFENPVDPLGVSLEFGPALWDKRLVGDSDSNKFPSFMGKTISAVTFASDRLGFSAGSSIVFSETGEHQNFFRTTVTNVIDSDRIDVTVASDENSDILWAKPMHKSIILLAAERQFSFDWNGALTPSTVSATQATAYQVSKDCEAVSVGSNLYFASEAGNFSHLLEMFVHGQSVVTEAADVSSHVPRYVPKNAIKSAASSNHSSVFLLSGDERDALYCYQFHIAGDQKVQSSWNRWTFAGIRILDIRCIEDSLWVIYDITWPVGATTVTEAFLGRVRLKQGDPGLATADFNHPVHLDQMVKVTGVFNANENRTFFTMASPLNLAGSSARVQAVFGTGFAQAGAITTPDVGGIPLRPTASPYQFFMDGNRTQGPMYIGLTYTQRLTFSEQFFDANNRAALTARLQIRAMTVSYIGTGFFKTEVKMKGAPLQSNSTFTAVSLVSNFSSRTLGDEHLRLSRTMLNAGTYRFPVLGRSSDLGISLVNDSYLPSNFISAEWEGLMSSRVRLG